MAETLAILSKLQVVQRAARCWTFSMCSVFTLVWGSQLAAAYSSCSRNIMLQPDQGIVGGLSHSRHFCSDLSLYEAEGFVCSCLSCPHVSPRLLVMSTPRYLAQLTVSRISPCSQYKLTLMGFLEPVTCSCGEKYCAKFASFTKP